MNLDLARIEALAQVADDEVSDRAVTRAVKVLAGAARPKARALSAVA